MAAGTLPAGSDDRFARSAQTPLARAWLPHAVGLAGIALLWLLQPDGAIESPLVLLALNFVFCTLASFAVAWMLVRRFLATGEVDLLLFTSGALLWGISRAAYTWPDEQLRAPLDGLLALTILNLSSWLSALCHLVAITLRLRFRFVTDARRLSLAAALVAPPVVFLAIANAASTNGFPVFFVPNVGGTIVRQFMVASTAIMFAIGAVLMRETPGPRGFSHWYALALLLLAEGYVALMLQRVTGSGLTWLGRALLCAAGIYMLIAARNLQAARTRDEPEFTLRAVDNRTWHILSIAFVIAAASFRMAFLADLGGRFAFLTFYPAVMLAALYGGVRAGTLAAILSALVVDYLWIEPIYALGTSRADTVAEIIFVVTCVLLSVITQYMRSAHERMRVAEAEAAMRGAIEERERRFHALADAMPQIVYVRRGDDTTEYVNRQWYAYTGQQAAEWNDAVHPDDAPRLSEAWRVARASRSSLECEIRMRRGKDRAYRWFLTRAVPVNDAAARAITWYGTATDIHEQKLTEQRLRESEERLQMALRASGMYAWTQDLATGRTVRSENARDILGITDATTEARAWDRIHPDDVPMAKTLSDRAIAELGEFNFDVRTQPFPDGRQVWLAVRGKVECDTDGRPLRMLGTAMDISSRKSAEWALRRQTDRLRLLWDAAAVLLSTDEPHAMLQRLFERIAASFDLDIYFHYLYDDGGVLRLQSYAGVSPAEADTIAELEPGRSISSRVAAEGAPRTVSFIQQSDASDEQVVRARGLRCYTCHPLIVDGRVLGTLSFGSRARDEFEADELEFFATICRYASVAYERLRLIGHLRDQDRRKDEFLATLAHELRNPLAPLRTGLEILRLSADKAEGRAWAQAVMERQMQHIVRLVDDLLDVSRITTAKLSLRMEPTDLNLAASAAVEASQAEIVAQRQILDLALTPAPVHVRGDHVRLTQIATNLITNAAKYSDPRGRITVEVKTEGSEAILRVTDTGMGIPPEQLDRIFEMFAQVRHPGRERQGGLGIGLHLVRRLTELHGGRVSARSDGPGHGSTFEVRLPLAGERAAPDDARVLDLPAARALRVLVADDNRDAADSLALLVRLLGHEALVARDGVEALELLRAHRPDVALLDLGMPQIDGFEVARRVREESWSAGLRLVALSGWGQEEDKRRSAAAGFDFHLVKPAETSDIARVLNASHAS